MAKNPWQQRIRRAEQLAGQHPFAAEILGFYTHVARFQQGLAQKLKVRTTDASGPLSDRPEFAELLANFPAFLGLVEEKAPAQFAQTARALHESPSSSWSELLNHCWDNREPPDVPDEFLAIAFLQPYAELVRTGAQLQLDGYTHPLCPFCSRKAAFAVLRQQGDGGRRDLLCGFCLCEWEFRRIVCPACGEENQAKLPVYTAEQFPHIRVECCDACQTYIKSTDLTKNGLADPLVDELASLPLDLWAHERGYAKIRPNLLGL
ncbi:MAG: formate dehydrogenase accessory protein FdhE [Terriglobales bacterium]